MRQRSVLSHAQLLKLHKLLLRLTVKPRTFHERARLYCYIAIIQISVPTARLITSQELKGFLNLLLGSEVKK